MSSSKSQLKVLGMTKITHTNSRNTSTPPPADESSLRLVCRPGKGSVGPRCMVMANHFLTELKNKERLQYHVIQGSSLDSAGLHVDDAIVQCGGKIVHIFLELLEMAWANKVGDILQLVVVRVCENDPIHINMVVDEVAVEIFYR